MRRGGWCFHAKRDDRGSVAGGGPSLEVATSLDNLVCLCPTHHRQLHHGELTISGDPETGTLRFYDARGRPIEPPEPGLPGPLRPAEPSPYTPPFGERLDARWFTWN